MSSSQPYPTLPGTIDPQQMSSDVAAGAVSTEWYAPSSYAYNDPYITPYPSSTVESQPWSAYARASVPDISSDAYTFHQQQQHQQSMQYQQLPPHFKDPSRPRSSPSTFGPGPETFAWPATSGLGIQYTSTAGGPTPVTSTFPPNVFQYPIDEQYSTSTSSPPEIRHPQPIRSYTQIAPNPSGFPSIKRPREEEELRAESSASMTGTSSKRRKRTSSVASADLSEDDRFLVQLKEDESLPWKDIATRFHTDKGKNFQVAALQMRYKRLREKYRVWEESDLNALRLAYDYWEKYKWEIISAKMVDFHNVERWPARHCARKWQEIESTTMATNPITAASITPGMPTQYSSPVDAPMHFAFMPIQ